MTTLAVADEVPADCASWTEAGDGTITCHEYLDDSLGGFDAEPGIPGFFGFFFVLVLLAGIAGTVWRVSTARRMARDSGMNVGDATAMTLLDEDGLSATYLASNFRGAPSRTADPAPASAAERLRELAGLRDQGLITQDEHDERRARIIDGV